MGTGVHEGKEVGGMRDLTLENVEGGYIGGGREGLLETFCLLVVIMRSAYYVPSRGPSTLRTFILFFCFASCFIILRTSFSGKHLIYVKNLERGLHKNTTYVYVCCFMMFLLLNMLQLLHGGRGLPQAP